MSARTEYAATRRGIGAQYVFMVPKMPRVYFRKDRRLLGKLNQCAADALKALFRAAHKGPRAVPGIINAVS